MASRAALTAAPAHREPGGDSRSSSQRAAASSAARQPIVECVTSTRKLALVWNDPVCEWVSSSTPPTAARTGST